MKELYRTAIEELNKMRGLAARNVEKVNKSSDESAEFTAYDIEQTKLDTIDKCIARISSVADRPGHVYMLIQVCNNEIETSTYVGLDQARHEMKARMMNVTKLLPKNLYNIAAYRALECGFGMYYAYVHEKNSDKKYDWKIVQL